MARSEPPGLPSRPGQHRHERGFDLRLSRYLSGAGGTVTNALSVSIHSSGLPTISAIAVVSGVNIEYATGSVGDYGTITSEGYGVGLQDGGSVINYASGSITGAEDAIFIERSYGMVDNFGRLNATFDDGVGFFNGGTLINEIGGEVTCLNATSGTGPSAVFFSRYSGTLQNDGTMRGTKAAAYFQMGGVVVNGADDVSALLQGDDFGVLLSNAPGSNTTETVTNWDHRRTPPGPAASISLATAAQ